VPVLNKLNRYVIRKPFCSGVLAAPASHSRGHVMSWWWASSASKITGEWPGELWLGGYQCATTAGRWSLIVNCADLDYPYDADAKRFWLHIACGDAWGPYEQNNMKMSWQARMTAALQIVMWFLSEGFTVLIHCRQGKHRAAAFCVTILLALYRWTWDKAINHILSLRDLQKWDKRISWPVGSDSP